MGANTFSAGKDVPNDIFVQIEIPEGSSIKYEVDSETGMLLVDRFLHTPMHYPLNYGYIPNTLGGDGDPIDVAVLAPQAVVPGSIIRCRPVGVLITEDESGEDAKIVAVAHKKMTPLYDNVQDIDDVPELTREQLKHFYEHYKDLEPGKWVKVTGWKNAEEAKQIINAGIEAAQN